MIGGHGGNVYALAETIGCEPSDIIDMSSNVNPLGPMPALVDFLKRHIEDMTILPEVDTKSAIAHFAKQYNIPPEHVIAGNGSTQLIYTVPIALKSRRALIIGPTYSDYADACIMHGVAYDYYISDESSGYYPDMDGIASRLTDVDTVFLCNPNNPTGVLLSPDRLKDLCEAHRDIFFIIDESYLPFVNNSDQYSMVHSDLPNVIILNSMSKIFRIPGLRVGFMIAHDDIISKANRFFQSKT
jgi:threonine-phosphate decarboxylase